MNNPFDELAKTLAKVKGVPRRDALRLIGSGLAGAVLASLGVGKAFGQGNSNCAHFCESVFPPGDDRGKCISAAAHGEGLCYECGPAAPPEHPPLCGTVCCGTGQVCCGGQVCCEADLCCNQVCCGGGQFCCGGQVCCGIRQLCLDGACVPPSVCGTGGTCEDAPACGGEESGCACFETVEGRGFCSERQQICEELQPCLSSVDCPEGFACSDATCCGPDAVCIPSCGLGA